MAKDSYDRYTPGTMVSTVRHDPVTPDDNNDLPYRSRAVHIGTSGDLEVDDFGIDNTRRTKVLPAMSNGWHAIRVDRIRATNTTATDITIAE